MQIEEDFRDNDFPAFPVIFQHEANLGRPKSSKKINQTPQDVFSQFPSETIEKLQLRIEESVHVKRYTEYFREQIQNLEIESFIQQQFMCDFQFFATLTDNLESMSLCRVGTHKVYCGQVDNNGCCEGMGVLIFKSGHIYEGQFSNNQRNGSGIYLEHGVGWYQGTFLHDIKEGEGVEVFYHKAAYLGGFQNGLRHGKGFYVDAHGNQYSGDWKLGIMHGRAFLKTPSSIYHGDMANWLKHGNGQLKFNNGDHYKGEFQNNKFDGFGSYKWRSGEILSTYEGNFKNGLRHGKGKWQSQGNDETKYIGNYSQGLKQGYGELYFPSGNFYKGNFVSDKREGYGEMFWTDSSFYKGQWREGIQNGKGQIYLSGGEVLNGIFQNSILVQIIPTFYEKQMLQMSTSAGTGNEYPQGQPTGIQHASQRAFSEHRRVNYRRKNLAKIQQNSLSRPQANSVAKNKLYFRSPERSDHSRGKLVAHQKAVGGRGHRQCKCVQRQQNFQLKQKKRSKLNKSLGNAIAS